MLSVRTRLNLISKFSDGDSRIPCVFEFTDLKRPIQTKLDRVVFLTGSNKGNYPSDHVFVTDNGIPRVINSIREDKCIQLLSKLDHELIEFPILQGNGPDETKDAMMYIFNTSFQPDSLVYITEDELERVNYVKLVYNDLSISKLYKEWIKTRIHKKNGMYRLPFPKLGKELFGTPIFSCKVVFGNTYPYVNNKYPKEYTRHAFTTKLLELTNNDDGENKIQHGAFAFMNITRFTAIPYNRDGVVDLSAVHSVTLEYTDYKDTIEIGEFSQGNHEIYSEQGNYLSYICHPINLNTYDGIDLLQSPYRGSFDDHYAQGSFLITVNFLKKGHVHIYTEGFDTLRRNEAGFGRDHVR